MDLARERKSSFKFNERLISLILYLPVFWLIYHILSLASMNLDKISSTKDLWNVDINYYLIEEFKKYRNFFYLIYTLILFGAGIILAIRKANRMLNKNKGAAESVYNFQYIYSKVIIAIILVTFSYAIAGLVLDLLNIFRR